MKLIKHDGENETNTALEARYNLFIALCALKSKLWFLKPMRRKYIEEHNWAVKEVRKFRKEWL